MGFFEDREDLGPPPEPFRIGGGDLRSPIPLRWIGVVAAILIGFIALSVAKGIYVDVLWFDSVGYAGVFKVQIFAKIVLFSLGFVITASVLGANIWIARRLAPQGEEESFIEEVDPAAIRRIVTILLVAATLFMAVIFGSVAGGSWETILSWRNGVSFGFTDPQFDRDISFYLFDLPAYHFLQGWFLALMIVSTLAAAAVYALSLSLQRFELNITRGMRIHLSLLVGIILLLIALSTYLGIFDLVSSPGGIVFGATYTDVNARLPVRYILLALAIIAGLVTIANGVLSENGYRLPLFAFGLWAFIGILGGLIYPGFVQRVQVEPNEREREEQFIARNIGATRFAYGLDNIDEQPFPAEAEVTLQEIQDNQTTVDNIRLVDPRPLRDTFKQLQAIRPFYDFADVDVDRYVINGTTQQVMLSARELNADSGGNWTRQRLQLTHGYGAVVAPVNDEGTDGLPDLITQDIPPVSEVLPITEDGARIYFGELTDDYVIVNTNEPEFDYPLGEGNSETFYSEDQGIKLSGFIRRFALFWELNDWNLMISGQLSADSRLLMNRSLTQRIGEVAPFLLLDRDPYIVIEPDGTLIWIQDAYTTAVDYPYSQPTGVAGVGTVNYIRNSVKVTVDAVTGEMVFYIIDPDDPVVATWAKIFPGLFTDASEMPAHVQEHLRYPLDLFQIQSEVYRRYHITDPSVFFIGEDVWNIPTEKFRQQEQPVQPYYVIMRLPGEETEEFVLILPFTPRNRQNTVAWMAGRSDGEALGTLKAYRFPTGDLVFGPAQIEARIDQNPGISQQITLWDQSGSEVIRGNLLMIPIGDSFLYVEPIYLQAESSRLPQLQRVVVANGNQIAMEPTFKEALSVVLGQRASSLPGSSGIFDPGSGTTDPTPTPSATATAEPGSIIELLQQAQEASLASEAELERLRGILEQLERALQNPPN
jgi:uncharacterized membrane protein (UPF0182 family)